MAIGLAIYAVGVIEEGTTRLNVAITPCASVAMFIKQNSILPGKLF